MAVEKLFFSINQDLLIKASQVSEEGSKLLLKGERDAAEEKMQKASKLISQTKEIDQLAEDTLSKLEEIGIKQPPVEFLKTIFPEVTEKMVERKAARAKKPSITPQQIPEFPSPENIPNLSPKEQAAYERLRLASPDEPISSSDWAQSVYPTKKLYHAKSSIKELRRNLIKKIEPLEMTIVSTASPVLGRHWKEVAYYLAKRDTEE